jgi:hypothetical protein
LNPKLSIEHVTKRTISARTDSSSSMCSPRLAGGGASARREIRSQPTSSYLGCEKVGGGGAGLALSTPLAAWLALSWMLAARLSLSPTLATRLTLSFMFAARLAIETTPAQY